MIIEDDASLTPALRPRLESTGALQNADIDDCDVAGICGRISGVENLRSGVHHGQFLCFARHGYSKM